MTKEEIINQLIEDNGYTAYLEIGYGDGYCFNQIECESKVAVDPNINGTPGVMCLSSDELFAGEMWPVDIVFIDGLHHAEQVRKDINNACKHLSETGAIILHDTYPHSEEMQEVPRKVKNWTGDCWRAAVGFIAKYPNVVVRTHKCDYGLTIIFPAGMKPRAKYESDMSYQEFDKKRDILLNVVRD